MRIAIIGADGQLGSDLVRHLSEDELLPLYYPDFDVTRPLRAREALTALHPDCIINTAAYHRVDECELHPERTFAINAFAVRELALICRDLSATLVHFSTDYVFDGSKNRPYVEDDPPNPLSVYAVSKLAGEFFVRNLAPRHFLVRTCGLYGEAGCWDKGMNFVDRVIALDGEGVPLRIVDDQRVTPTSTWELAGKVGELIRTERFGLYHLTNEGDCTWYEFAVAIFSFLGRSADLRPVSTENYGARARRPAYSVLENKNAKSIGLSDFAPWNKALSDYLVRKGHSAADRR